MYRSCPKYSQAELATIKEMREAGKTWPEIGVFFGVSGASVKSANYYRIREGCKSAQDETPTQPRAWPRHTDYSPDNLDVRT